MRTHASFRTSLQTMTALSVKAAQTTEAPGSCVSARALMVSSHSWVSGATLDAAAAAQVTVATTCN